ncbi:MULTISPECIES: hypothetical protein [Rhodococcus]|uniref:hypothetical protein n=1 Tax=Rhodococcus TaxID=1827 RepID=UPI0011AEDAAA|nr:MULTISPECIES: hypothetical protein [Rhodococcus]WKX01339.1 hypothetical protein Q3O43_14080 [Rhodococcus aetherivorans]
MTGALVLLQVQMQQVDGLPPVDPTVGSRMIEQARRRATPNLIAVFDRNPLATHRHQVAQLISASDRTLRTSVGTGSQTLLVCRIESQGAVSLVGAGSARSCGRTQ